MPYLRQIREATRNHRKQPLRDVQRDYRHSRGLSSSQIDLRAIMQYDILIHDACQMKLIEEMIQNEIELEEDLNRNENNNFMQEEVINGHTQILEERIYHNWNARNRLMREESQLFDLLYHHELLNRYDPPRFRTFVEWNDRLARGWTGFVVDELIEIAEHFDLVRGNQQVQNAAGNYYNFTCVELFLFGMVKIYSGMNNQQLCDCIFGGSARRWSDGFKWFLMYIDKRYRRVISFAGLCDEVCNFPRYAKAICRKINTNKFYVNPITGDRFDITTSALFDEENFKIFSFLDGTYQKSNLAGSGPHGDYEGSMRRPNWFINQRSIYNGYKRLHGLHLLTVMLPTGINYCYGPSSARGGDQSAMMHSQLNEFLEFIQLNHDFGNDANGIPKRYATHGDMLFAPRSCVSRNHRQNRNQPLQNWQLAENYALNLVRITIEQSYAFLRNKHKIIVNPNEFKLMNGANPHAIQLLRVCMLLCNITICMSGMQVNNRNCFCCPPPSLDEYLHNPIIN